MFYLGVALKLQSKLRSMGGHQRIWTPDGSSETKNYIDTLFIYDAGDFIGYLTQKNQSKRWSGYTLLSRERKDSRIIETLESSHEFTVPLHFFSIESYPALIESSTLWIPGWKIQMVPLPKQQSHESEVRRDLLQPPLPQQQPPLHQQNPRQQQPLSRPVPSQHQSSSQHPRRSPSGKQELSQRPSQNKSNNVTTQKALPSSNQVSHEKPKRSAPKKSEAHPSPSSEVEHIEQRSQWYPLSQVNPSSPLPLMPPGSNQQSTSSSQNPISSKSHSPSQQAQRRRGGTSRRPIVSQQSSLE